MRKRKDVIIPSCANLVMPLTLILGFYVILHGHLSPGGGFQGGVLVAGAITIVYLSYGKDMISKVFHAKVLKLSENVGALGFVLIATLGIIYGVSFFSNVVYKGSVGKLFSSGTIFLMNFAVGYKVLAGVGFLIIVMLSTLSNGVED